MYPRKEKKKLYATIKNMRETSTIILIIWRGSSIDHILNIFFNDYEFESF
jgi:hypothetical protein